MLNYNNVIGFCLSYILKKTCPCPNILSRAINKRPGEEITLTTITRRYRASYPGSCRRPCTCCESRSCRRQPAARRSGPPSPACRCRGRALENGPGRAAGRIASSAACRPCRVAWTTRPGSASGPAPRGCRAAGDARRSPTPAAWCVRCAGRGRGCRWGSAAGSTGRGCRTARRWAPAASSRPPSYRYRSAANVAYSTTV